MLNELKKMCAALTMFTRLPWYRLCKTDTSHYAHAAAYWPFVGWITGLLLALTFWITARFMPTDIAIIVAISARLLFTGAMHEDGLADYFDGMGGGRNREQTLRIMKDSHIGTYGVLGLVVYFMLLFNIMQELFGVVFINTDGDLKRILFITLTTDVWAKCCASLLTGLLPYARNAEEAKTHVVYTPLSRTHILRILFAMLPSLILVFAITTEWAVPIVLLMLLVPFAVMTGLAMQMRHRLQGYTGDCCGATFLLCELSAYFTLLFIARLPF